jgi:nicotinamidase-related amidase
MAIGLSRPPGDGAVHLCVDMQRIFSREGVWPTPWMERVLPVVTAIARHAPQRTIFTRFMTPFSAHEMPGVWRDYYEKWDDATRRKIAPDMLELMPELQQFAPPAQVLDKTRYSAFAETALHAQLQRRGVDTLVITGSETDVCVLATVLDAVDHGLRVILVRDAVCSSSDAGHDALLQMYQRRYSVQIEVVNADELLACWRS